MSRAREYVEVFERHVPVAFKVHVVHVVIVVLKADRNILGKVVIAFKIPVNYVFVIIDTRYVRLYPFAFYRNFWPPRVVPPTVEAVFAAYAIVLYIVGGRAYKARILIREIVVLKEFKFDIAVFAVYPSPSRRLNCRFLCAGNRLRICCSPSP